MAGECPECGRNLSGDERYCPGCGCDLTSVYPSVCPECEYDLSGDERYCPGCGHDLDGQATQETHKEGTGETSLLTTRRAALGMLSIGAIGAGGGWIAAHIGGTTDSAAAPPRTDTPSETPSDTGTATPTATETSTATEMNRDWPMFQYDQFNTGHIDVTIDTNGSIQEDWMYSVDNPISAGPLIYDGTLYVGDQGGHLYAVDITTGDALWQSTIGSKIVKSGAISGGEIIVGNGDGTVYSVTRQNGEINWSQNIGRSAVQQTVVDGIVYTSRSGFGQIVALNAQTGAIKWRYEARGGIGGNIESAPAVADSNVLFGGNNSYIVALDRETGDRVWTYDTGDAGTRELGNNPGSRVKGDPSIYDNTVFAANSLGTVVAVNLSDGSELWKYEVGDPVRTSPAIDGTNLYVGDSTGTIHAFDIKTGSVQWTYTTDGDIRHSSAVTTSQSVYFGNSSGKIFSFNSSDGDLNWSYQAKGRIGPLAVADWRLFATTAEGNIHALSH